MAHSATLMMDTRSRQMSLEALLEDMPALSFASVWNVVSQWEAWLSPDASQEELTSDVKPSSEPSRDRIEVPGYATSHALDLDDQWLIDRMKRVAHHVEALIKG